MDKKLLGIMTHCVGWEIKGNKKREKRNWYATTKDSPDVKILDKALSNGLMTRQKAPDWAGDDFIYRVTQKGFDALKEHFQQK